MVDITSFKKSCKGSWNKKDLDIANRSKWKVFFNLELENVEAILSLKETLTLFRPGGGGFCPHGLWTFITLLISKLRPPNLVTFPKI